jgi:hypothetical protein
MVDMTLALNPQIALAQEFGGHYGGLIPINRLIGGTISDDVHYVEYTITGDHGQNVVITLQAVGAGGLDPLLKLRGPGIDTPLVNDDGWFEGNSILRDITLPESGSLTVTATRSGEGDGTSVGNYLLLATTEHPKVAYYGILSPNQCIVGAISDDIYAVEHTFPGGRAGQVVTIVMERLNGNLDTFLSVRDRDEVVIATNDDDGLGLNSILQVTLEKDSDLTITATRWQQQDGSSTGEYKLWVKTDPYEPRQGGVLRPHQIIWADTTIPSQPESITYSFDYYYELGHGVAITVMHPTIDGLRPVLQLYDPNSNLIDSGTIGTSNWQVTTLDCPRMPQTGTYTTTVEGLFYNICLRDTAYA